ncbi:8771_t:CDS:1, partial [Dentiscutata erythropus]
KQQKFEKGDMSNNNEEPPKISVIKGLNRLKKFISFVKQQESCDFNIEELKIFRNTYY